MKTFTIHVPDTVDELDVKMQLAAYLFDKGMLTSGQAADMVGITKRKFIEIVGNYGVSVFGETPEDIASLLNA